jgi:hypothetical protein
LAVLRSLSGRFIGSLLASNENEDADPKMEIASCNPGQGAVLNVRNGSNLTVHPSTLKSVSTRRAV